MTATNLYNIGSSPAPDKWRELPEIKDAHPKKKKCEISLQKLDDLPMAVWMVSYIGGQWEIASDFFYVK